MPKRSHLDLSARLSATVSLADGIPSADLSRRHGRMDEIVGRHSHDPCGVTWHRGLAEKYFRVPNWTCLVLAVVGWLVVATVLGLLLGAIIRRRDPEDDPAARAHDDEPSQ